MNEKINPNLPLVTITASDVGSQSVEWLAEPMIAFGTVTCLFGDSGLGKSFSSLAIAADLTNGNPVFGLKNTHRPMNVIIQNAENSFAKVIVPRLKMLGADLSRVHTIDTGERPLTLTDARIEQAIERHNARYLVLDPLQAHIGSHISMNSAESIRAAIMRLSGVAERTGAALLIVGHLNKGNNGKAQYRSLGSVDIFNAVPSVMFLGETEDGVKAIVHAKSNLSELSSSVAFSLDREDGFRWLGECDVTLDELLNTRRRKTTRPRTRTDEAVEFLRSMLSGGREPAADMRGYAEAAGISAITLERAKKELGVVSLQNGGKWFWSLPE